MTTDLVTLHAQKDSKSGCRVSRESVPSLSLMGSPKVAPRRTALVLAVSTLPVVSSFGRRTILDGCFCPVAASFVPTWHNAAHRRYKACGRHRGPAAILACPCGYSCGNGREEPRAACAISVLISSAHLSLPRRPSGENKNGFPLTPLLFLISVT